MAIKKVIDIVLNTKDATKSAETLTKSMTNLDASFEDVYGEIQPLTGRMGELEDRMYELANAGQQNTQEFKDLQQEVGRYKKVMIETDMAVDAVAQTTSQKLGGALSGVAGGFSVAQGLMASFGADSKAVEEALLKVQGAMAISQGLDSVRESIGSFKALASAIGTTAIGQKLLTGAQIAGAVAMRILNAVMNANPVFLLITGVTALAGAIYYFAQETEKAEEVNEELNKSFEKGRTQLDQLSTALVKTGERRLALLQSQGASEKELHAQRVDNLKREQVALNGNLTYEKLFLKNKREAQKQALKEGNTDLAKTIADEIKASSQKYKTLVEQHKDLNVKKKIEDNEYTRKLEEDAKAEAEKQKARNQEAIERQKQRNEESLKVQRQLKDMEIALIQSEDDRQRATIQENYNRQIEDLKKNTLIGLEQRKLLTEAFEKERVASIEAIEKEAQAKTLEAEKKHLEDLAKAKQEWLDEEEAIAEIVFQAGLDDDEKEIIAVQEKYFALIEMARQHGIDTATLEEEQQTLIAEIEDKYRAEAEAKDKEAFDKKKAMFDAYSGELSGGLQSISDLGNILTDIQLQNAEGNDAKQLAIQKKAFERNKKIQIAMATISGIQGVINALTAQSVIPDPFGAILKGVNAAIVGATTIANIAKIKATTFQGGGGGGAVSSGGGGGGGNVPNFNIVGAGGSNQIAQGLAGQETPVVKTFVTAGDVTTQQSLDRNKVENATL